MNKLTLLAGFIAAGLSGCGTVSDLTGPAEADIPAIEKMIKSGVLEQADVRATVECPSQIDWEVNDTFNCVVTDKSTGDVAMAVVTMENDSGDVTWQIG